MDACLIRQRGNGERCLELAESLGWIAWTLHCGSFVLPLAETVLREDSALVDAAGSAEAIDPASVRDRTLHVLTEAYAVGGHTRLVKRWIELLDDEPHAIVLVRQLAPLDPAWVKPLDRDVPLIDLEKAGVNRRTSKVARLMELFRSAKRVILQIHPNDACSVAAAYRVPGVDIRFLNHADHVAWLGAGLPAALLNLRHRGTQLAGRARDRSDGLRCSAHSHHRSAEAGSPRCAPSVGDRGQ